MRFLNLTTLPDLFADKVEIKLGVGNLALQHYGSFLFLYRAPNSNKFRPYIASHHYTQEAIAILKTLIQTYPVLVSEHFAKSEIYTLKPEQFSHLKNKCKLGIKGCELVAPNTILLGDTYYFKKSYGHLGRIQPYEVLMKEWEYAGTYFYPGSDYVDVRLVLSYPHLFITTWKSIFESLWQSDQKSFDEEFLKEIKELSSLAFGELPWGVDFEKEPS